MHRIIIISSQDILREVTHALEQNPGTDLTGFELRFSERGAVLCVHVWRSLTAEDIVFSRTVPEGEEP